MARADLIENMVADLRNVHVDLNDEGAVMRALRALRYGYGDIVVCVDEVREAARGRQKNLSSIIADSAVAVFAVGVWLAWYAVLCPAVS
jgi:hypothetical protein